MLEYANLGDLFHYVTSRTRLTEDQARCVLPRVSTAHRAAVSRATYNPSRWFFQQLMISVDYLHRRMEIAHRCVDHGGWATLEMRHTCAYVNIMPQGHQARKHSTFGCIDTANTQTL